MTHFPVWAGVGVATEPMGWNQGFSRACVAGAIVGPPLTKNQAKVLD